jgi:hypothetical protein
MAGIGLTNALLGYQQGVAWKQQQEEIARQRAQREAFEAANREGLSVIDRAKERWAAAGAPGQFKPDDALMFEAAETRGTALAKAGLWDQFMSNQAQVAPMRLKARAQALQEYDMTGDADKFMRSIYPTMSGGKRIVGSEQVEGADAVAGLAAIPTKTTFKFDDGTTQTFTNEQMRQLYGRVKASLVDPATSARNEALMQMEELKARLGAQKEAQIAQVKGEEARKTEDLKGANARGLEAVRFGYNQQIHGMDNASRERAAAGNNAATLGAANIGAQSRLQAATIRAGEGKGGTDKRVKSFKDIHDQVTRIIGMPQQGLMGGNKVSDEQTLLIAKGAQAVMSDDPNIDVGTAIQKSIAEWKKRGGKPRPVPFGQTLSD